MKKFNELVESVLNEATTKYKVSVNDTEKILNLDLSNENKTIKQIVDKFKKDIGSGHDGKELEIRKDGSARLTVTAYTGGPDWTLEIKKK